MFQFGHTGLFGTRCDSERGASGVQGCAGAPAQRDLASIADLSRKQMPSCGIVEEGRLFLRSRPSELSRRGIPCLWHLPTSLAARMAVSSATVSLIISGAPTGAPTQAHNTRSFACLLRIRPAASMYAIRVSLRNCDVSLQMCVRHWCACTQLRRFAASMYVIGVPVRHWCAKNT